MSRWDLDRGALLGESVRGGVHYAAGGQYTAGWHIAEHQGGEGGGHGAGRDMVRGIMVQGSMGRGGMRQGMGVGHVVVQHHVGRQGAGRQSLGQYGYGREVGRGKS